jgi:hypothetical protein
MLKMTYTSSGGEWSSVFVNRGIQSTIHMNKSMASLYVGAAPQCCEPTNIFTRKNRPTLFFPASVAQKDKEIFDLKAKIAEVLAVMPGSMGSGGGMGGASVRSPAGNAVVGSGRASGGVFVPRCRFYTMYIHIDYILY